jgi:tRNA A37 threonylcarbamoyladenosine dehydratase
MNDPFPDHPEQFFRTALIWGWEALRRLQRAQVVVVGLGAVGSYAVEALARAGVGRFRLVDYDAVGPSNLNRQLYALHSTIGQFKTDVAGRRVKDINPACEVQTLNLRITSGQLDEALTGPPDLLVDAIDQIDAKVELIAAAQRQKVPLVSSMGAARRTDPSRIQVALLSETHGCPLARAVRIRLRRKRCALDFPCVFSTEPRVKPILEPLRTGGPAEAFRGPKPKSRPPIGSLPTLTGIVGLTLAHAALQILVGQGRGRAGPLT